MALANLGQHRGQGRAERRWVRGISGQGESGWRAFLGSGGLGACSCAQSKPHSLAQSSSRLHLLEFALPPEVALI